MSRYPEDWRKLTRKPKEGGRVYIPAEVLDEALDSVGIPRDSKLMVRAFKMKGEHRTARILLKVRIEGEEERWGKPLPKKVDP